MVVFSKCSPEEFWIVAGLKFLLQCWLEICRLNYYFLHPEFVCEPNSVMWPVGLAWDAHFTMKWQEGGQIDSGKLGGGSIFGCAGGRDYLLHICYSWNVKIDSMWVVVYKRQKENDTVCSAQSSNVKHGSWWLETKEEVWVVLNQHQIVMYARDGGVGGNYMRLWCGGNIWGEGGGELWTRWLGEIKHWSQ